MRGYKQMKRARFSKNSVFAHTWRTLGSIFVVLFVLFTGCIWGIISHAQNQRVDETNQQILEQSGEMLDYTLRVLDSALNQIQWNEEVISYLIRASENDSGAEIRIIRSLESMKAENPLIKGIGIYRPKLEWLLDNQGFSGQLDKYPDSKLLRKFLPDMPESGSAAGQGQEEKITLIMQENRLYLVHYVVLAHYIGNVFLEIDIPQLYETLQLNENHTAIFLSDGTKIRNEENDSSATSFPEWQTLKMGELKSAEKSGNWYTLRSNFSGLCLIQEQQTDMGDSLWKILPVSLFALAILMATGVAGAYRITRKIYDPINRLTASVLQYRQDQLPENENELTYLQLSFFRTVGESQKLKQSMEYFGAYLVQQVFRRILQGMSLRESGLYELPEETQKVWLSAGTYQVMLCKIQVSDMGRLAAGDNTEICSQSIQQIIKEKGKIPLFTVVPMEAELLAVVLAERKEKQQNLDMCVYEIVQEIESMFASNVLFQVKTVYGQGGTSLEMLADLWKQEREQIRYAAYLEKSEEIGKSLEETTQTKGSSYIERAVQYMQENFTDSSMSVQTVAEYLGISGNYFSELFNVQMRESFTVWLNRLRVEKAQELLRATDISIRDIGFKCGFNTVQHFNRMFKKYNGVTPGQYRDKNR